MLFGLNKETLKSSLNRLTSDSNNGILKIIKQEKDDAYVIYC